MRSQRRFTSSAALAAVLLSTIACSGSSGSAAQVAQEIPLTGIQITPVSATLAVGAIMPFDAQGVLQNDELVNLTAAVDWASSDTTVATVSGGVVTALAVGDATITATDPATGFAAYASIEVLSVPGALSYVDLSRGSVIGGTALTGTVALNAMVDHDAVVTLWTDPSGLVTVPASVTVPAGQLSASFDVATSAVAERTTVTVYAWDETFDEAFQKTATVGLRAEK